MQVIAVNWHVYQLLRGTTYTLALFGHSIGFAAGALGLGVLGFVRVVPIIAFGLFGGMVADSVDRRRIIMGSQVAAAASAAALAAFTLTGRVSVPILYLFSALDAAVAAFDGPAQQSLVPHLVPRRDLANAISLYILLWQIGTITGPALAGLVIARVTIGAVYALNALSFVAVLFGVRAMRYRGHVSGPRSSVSRKALLEGLRFTHGARLIWSTMLLDFLATFFSSARTMLPIVADRVLGVGVQGYGLLATAQPVGAILTGVALTLRKELRHQGPTLLISVAIYGLATACFGFSTIFALSYLFFALTGAADTVSTVIRHTIRQMLTPDHLRGRMSSVHMILASGGPQLGELEAGLVAALWGAPIAIITGGVATVLLTAWVAWASPALRHYQNDRAHERISGRTSMQQGG